MINIMSSHLGFEIWVEKQDGRLHDVCSLRTLAILVYNQQQIELELKNKNKTL